ncbi:MAG: response regulator, partial [Chitinophagaceae bacterium]
MVTNTLGSLKVLLAEDNEINRLIATTVLNRWGFITVMAADGAEAVKQLKENHFDLVLMDIQMPKKDGIEATKDIRAMDDAVKKNIPISFIIYFLSSLLFIFLFFFFFFFPFFFLFTFFFFPRLWDFS